MAEWSMPTGPLTGSYTKPATGSSKPSVVDRVSDTARGVDTPFGVSTGIGTYIPAGVQAAQDAVAKQLQDAWSGSSNRIVVGSSTEPSSWAVPTTYTTPSYGTTSLSGGVTDPNQGRLKEKSGASSVAASSANTSGKIGNAPGISVGSGGSGGSSGGDLWPGYQENYPQYVNPFGNEKQVQALNDYAKQLEKQIVDYANQALRGMQDNAVALATTPGAMEAAKAALEGQIGNAINDYRTIINQGASSVINNPIPDSAFSGGGSSGGSGVLPSGGLPSGGLPTGDGGAGDGAGGAEGAGEAPGLSTNSPAPYELPDLPGPNPERVNHVDTEPLRDMLQQIVDMQQEQSNKTIDYSVERGTNELNRAMEDAAKNYQTQRNQVAADEARALDNQALYSEARGDRGGIGEAQYAAIQNTAAQNRRAVNDAQVKLGTDTARQIADLRAQGEFEKADQLLSIAQSHMSQLMNLEQWALGTNLGVDEFNSQLQQWVDEYNLDKQKFLSDLDLSAAQLTGMFSDATRTHEAEQALISSLANSGNTMLQMGIMPSKQQLQAMGLTQSQAQQYIAKVNSPLGSLGIL